MRAYLMRGLGGIALSRGMDEIGALIEQQHQDVIVQVGDWSDLDRFLRDAIAYPAVIILFGGHSMGCKASFDGGGQLLHAKRKVRVVGLDPLCTAPVMTPGLDATNIWGNPCGELGPIPGARNIQISGPTHIEYPSDPTIQARFMREAFR